MRARQIFTRFSLLGLIALLAFIGNINILWQSLIEEKYILVYLVSITLFLTYVGFFLAYRKLFTVISMAKESKNERLLEHAQTVHLLCKNPLCDRCRPFHYTFSLIGVSLIANRSFWIKVDSIIFGDSLMAIVIGIILFTISTPIFGYLGRLYPEYPFVKKFEDPLIKMVCGFISAISLGFIGGAIGIILSAKVT